MICADQYFKSIQELGYEVSGPSTNIFSLSTYERAVSISSEGNLISTFTKNWESLGHADVVRSIDFFRSNKSPRIHLRAGNRSLKWLNSHITVFGFVKP